MIKLKTFDEMLEVVLTTEEKNDRSAKMSKTILERMRLKNEAKRTAESFSSKIKLLDQEIEGEACILEDGKEFRKVPCKEAIAFNGIEVEVIRTDTWEIVRTRAMTAEERQEDLFPTPVEATEPGTEESQANAEKFFGQDETKPAEDEKESAPDEKPEGETVAQVAMRLAAEEINNGALDTDDVKCAAAVGDEPLPQSRLSYEQLLDFAQNGSSVKNPASHARKWHLTGEVDQTAEAWLAQPGTEPTPEAKTLAAGHLCACGHTRNQHYGQNGNLGCDECEICHAFADVATMPAPAPKKARKTKEAAL
jgi:hypothetical protein